MVVMKAKKNDGDMKTKNEASRKPDAERREGAGAGGLLTRGGLAAALRVSVRTVDRMVAAGEIAPVRLRGWTVRFYLPDVVECLRNESRKFGRRAGMGEGCRLEGQ